MTELAVDANLMEPKYVEFDVVPAYAYIGLLALKIKEAEDRAIVQAMSIGRGEHIDPILSALMDRAEDPGFLARLIADGHSLLFDDEHAAYIPPNLRVHKIIHGFRKCLNELADSGVQVAVINRFLKVGRGVLRFNPYAGRNHIKGDAVDEFFSMTGPNKTDGATRRYDFALTTENKVLANWMDQFTLDQYICGRIPAEHDFEIIVDEESSILVDVGTPEKSLIYDTACAILASEDVKHIYFVNQFFPTGKYLALLEEQQLRLGVGSVQSLTSHYSHFGFPVSTSQRRRQKSSGLRFETSQGFLPVHTKVLLVTKTDGTKQLIVTSHNFDERGVRYGTAETALVTTNKKTIDNVLEYCRRIPRKPFTR